MALTTILVDSREQKPWTFTGYPVTTREVTLRTGDYTLEQFCDHDPDADTYYPQLAVERKSGPDLLQSMTHRREDFKAEIKRAAEWPDELQVIVEEPWDTYAEQTGFMQYRDVHPNQIEGTIDAWEKHYNVEFSFTADRATAERDAFDQLITWLRKGPQ